MLECGLLSTGTACSGHRRFGRTSTLVRPETSRRRLPFSLIITIFLLFCCFYHTPSAQFIFSSVFNYVSCSLISTRNPNPLPVPTFTSFSLTFSCPSSFFHSFPSSFSPVPFSLFFFRLILIYCPLFIIHRSAQLYLQGFGAGMCLHLHGRSEFASRSIGQLTARDCNACLPTCS